MSSQAPQVLSRRANGGPQTSSNQTSEPTKGKGSHENSSHGKARGRGSNARSTEANKHANESETPKPTKTKAHNEGEKLVIRRLPPGMTQAEFVSILGSEWELGKGKVDWFSFAGGKISTDPSKPSRPGRAYVHVMKKDDILPLSDAVRTAVWEDAKASFNSPSLIGPPSVEFAIYKKVPSNKKRTDARQGTIDQDPEFMAFLEELANPAPPKETVEGEEGDDLGKVETKVTTTPLIEYLKEKKANKAKESSSSKNSKHGQDSRSAKGKNSSKDEDSGKKKGKESKAEKGEKTPKETVKILTKKATPEPNAETSKTNAKSQPNDSSAQETAPKSRRAGILAAARILQRDLGLSPGSAHRKARQDAAKAEADAKTPEKESTSTAEAKASASESPSTPVKSAEAEAPEPKGRGAANANKQQQSNRRTRGGKNAEKSNQKEKGKENSKEKEKVKESTSSQPAPNPPIVLLKKKATDAESNPPAKPANTTTQAPAAQGGRSKADNAAGGSKGGPNKGSNAQKKHPTVSPDATRGFVKHANPSQGVTEALLKQTLSAFGTITFVEIDKRKGFAYVDFAEHEGLVKAVTASPIPVAQGTVQVLERKDKKPASTNANAATTAPVPVAGSAAPEKASGRGRRGRGGGNKVKDSGPNNQGTAPPPPAPANAGG
ncbi:Regulator of nonsense transcripts 3A [Fusarium oxysporum f. sp. cubense race 1]|uniref:Regulator of nonsense transcripts 3A n=1 Tax=Fusarium oxysporum f. sp. cubense (strain race 1) TaxID=1229664 RepID=N4UQQ3_FUSC1|nr:Regulator of nonsense transcripts 3A [Fusarium oxysporum f. sp. cubense race 1]